MHNINCPYTAFGKEDHMQGMMFKAVVWMQSVLYSEEYLNIYCLLGIAFVLPVASYNAVCISSRLHYERLKPILRSTSYIATSRIPSFL